jgi:Protein of unknown function (DUF2992)
MIEGSFTVTFEDPFWVGILERFDERGYSVTKIIFGSEPNAETIRLTVLRQYLGLNFSEPVPERPAKAHELNYKRRQLGLKRLLGQEDGPSAEVSGALAAERKRQTLERKQREKAEREAEEAHKLEIRLERKKEKKKGH